MEDVVTEDGWIRIEQPLDGHIYVRANLAIACYEDTNQGAAIQLINGTIYKIAEEPSKVVERLQRGIRAERKAARL